MQDTNTQEVPEQEQPQEDAHMAAAEAETQLSQADVEAVKQDIVNEYVERVLEEAGDDLITAKVETAPYDPRFPAQNQARHCFVRYNEYYKCAFERDPESDRCQFYKRAYNSLCPADWVEEWETLRSEGKWCAMAREQVSQEPGVSGKRSKNIIELIRIDHDRARSLWEQYKQTMNWRAKQELGYAITREVSQHAAKEEEVLYPAVREKLGDRHADDMISAHQRLKDGFAELNRMTARDPNLDGKLQQVMKTLIDHMRDEEQSELPRFARAPGVSQQYLEQLGRGFDLAKLTAPTRPHPWAPNKPPLNYIANTLAAPLDGFLDLWRFEGAPPL